MSKLKSRLIKISKIMSLILRHYPGRFGVTLDAEGYASIDDLLAAVRRGFPDVTCDDILAIVREIEPEKQRFSIVDEDIRANYGHSLKERIEHQAEVPPPVLYHGTHEKAVDAILNGGLHPMKRQYVHLTINQEIALKVGARRGKPCLIQVDADRAYSDGVRFYKANESFWLTDGVKPAYLKIANNDEINQ